MRVSILATTVALVLLAAAPSAAQDAPHDPDAQARAAFLAGVEHYKAEELEDALFQFRRAYELKPSWKILYNIGQCEAALGRFGLALDVFEQYMVEGGDEVPVERADWVSDEVRRIQPLVGVIEVEAPDDTLVLIDGHKRKKTPLKGPLRVASGDHKVVLLHGEKILLSDTFTVAGGMTTTVEAPADEPEQPTPAEAEATAPDAPPDPPEPPAPERPERKKALMIAGIATFGGGYLFAVLVGWVTYSEAGIPPDEECSDCKPVGKRMFIPLVGPFLAIGVSDSKEGKATAGVMGGVQAAGLAMAVVGTIIYIKSGKPKETALLGRERDALARLRLTASPESGGGTLLLGWEF